MWPRSVAFCCLYKSLTVASTHHTSSVYMPGQYTSRLTDLTKTQTIDYLILASTRPDQTRPSVRLNDVGMARKLRAWKLPGLFRALCAPSHPLLSWWQEARAECAIANKAHCDPQHSAQSHIHIRIALLSSIASFCRRPLK